MENVYLPVYICSIFTIKCLGLVQKPRLGRVGKPETCIYFYLALSYQVRYVLGVPTEWPVCPASESSLWTFWAGWWVFAVCFIVFVMDVTIIFFKEKSALD